MHLKRSPFIAPAAVDPLEFGRRRFCPSRMQPRRDEGGHGGGEGGSGGEGGTGGGGGDGGKGGGEGERTFTQADVDRIVQGRLSKYSDYDDVVRERDELKSANATEAEKAIDQARKEARDEVLATSNERLLRAESRGLAAELQFHNPGEAHMYLDTENLPIKDGDVDIDALRAQLEQIAQDRPYLVADGAGSASYRDVGIGRKGSAPDPGPGVARLEHAFDAAYRTK